MKKVLLFALFGALVSCDTLTGNESEMPEENAKSDPLEGSWEMTAFHALDEATGDTIFSEERHQFKLYSDNHMVWVNSFDADSTDLYGMGSYEIKGDTLYEHVKASAFPIREFMSKNPDFAMHFTYTDSTYTQYIPDSTMMIVEVYKRID